VRVGEENRKGYAREDFEDAWERYCPLPDSLSETAKHPADTAENPVSEGSPERTKRNAENPHRNADVSDVSDSPGEDEEMRRTGIIQSERQVFELAREHFGLNEKGGAA
jgi:hypothetical protein